MRRIGLVLVLALVSGGSVAGFTYLPPALQEMELFRVDRVEIQGLRYLAQSEVREALALSPAASVWDDRGPMELRLAGLPLVRAVRIRRRLPGTLVVEVTEREPVAMVPTPTIEPVDAEGRVLPIDPVRHGLDLPILRAHHGGGVSGPPSAEQLRGLADAVDRLAAMDPALARAVSEVAYDPRGDVLIRLADPEVDLRTRSPLGLQRIEEGLRVLSDAMSRRPDELPTAVDLRFADQVVVAYRRGR